MKVVIILFIMAGTLAAFLGGELGGLQYAYTGVQIVATVGVAYAAGWIAFNQYRVAHAKFKLDLFEKRVPVFDVTRSYLSAVLSEVDGSVVERAFVAQIPSAGFLFGKAMATYMKDIQKKAVQLRSIRRTLTIEGLDEERHGQLRGEFTTISAALIKERDLGAAERFAPFLDLSEWK